jgi:predicted phage baseplate assembly protein
MTPLAPDLFDRRFDDLLDIGRSRLTSLAPGWTDHNLHDPGITLLELMAWVTEAQLYALSRMRRDERSAYAALLGIAPRGPLPAGGAIWPMAGTEDATRSRVIDAGTAVVAQLGAGPAYRTLHRQLWLAGRIRALRTVGADGRVEDHGATNERGNVVFLPFGARAGAHDVMALDIVCPADGGLFPARRADAEGAFLMIGVLADATSGDAGLAPPAQPLAVTLNDGAARHEVDVVEDATAGFMRSGVLVLDVSRVPQSPRAFSLEFRAPRGFARPPRVTRIGLNVVPVRQGAVVERELHIAGTLPDQVLRLQQPGLQFGAGAAPVKVEVDEDGALRTWTRCDRLDAALPGDAVYVLDPARATITFGNGVNGRLPPAGAQILLTYVVCDGADGNAVRNQRWIVHGFDGPYGVNPEPMQGGRNGADRADQRREARRRARADHALVTAADLEAEALALPALEVARAWAPPAGAARVDGTVTLVAMRSRPGGIEPADAPETERWLSAVARALAPRVPLGQRLRVRAPRYVPFRIALRVEAAQGVREDVVAARIRTALRERLAPTAASPGGMQRAFGLDVTQRDVAAWTRKVEGVGRVLSLRLLDMANRPLDSVAVPRLGLPRIVLEDSDITVQRPPQGRTG